MRTDNSLTKGGSSRHRGGRIEDALVVEKVVPLWKAAPAIHHYRRPVERPFQANERARVTCLFGGLTFRHEKLIETAVTSLGYRLQRLPVPTRADYLTGREYGNPGMCNPAYFTMGALINHLKHLRDDLGVPTRRILDDYVYLTAGSRGPCRFGMYEAEYRHGLRNSGFDGFRIVSFQQTGGLQQAVDDAGLVVDARFGVSLLLAIMLGDLLNDVAYQIRPYELNAGETDRVFGEILSDVTDELERWVRKLHPGGWWARWAARITGSQSEHVQKIFDLVFGNTFTGLLSRCAARINAIQVDYMRPKPICKIIGEAWAQMTEGDGNFRMFSFLESHGAEVYVESLTTWVNYLLYSARRQLAEERNIQSSVFAPVLGPKIPSYQRAITDGLVNVLSRVINREFERMRLALGGLGHAQADQGELHQLAQPFFNHQITGGEGHLEVGKTIYYSIHQMTHMLLSLKPFGCMPSTQSDGAQAAVVGRYPDILFLPVETSGEGDVNAYSRVQMILGEARNRCRREFEQCVEKTGYRLEDIRRYWDEHEELHQALGPVQKYPGVIGKAANFVLYVGKRMDQDKAWAPLKKSIC